MPNFKNFTKQQWIEKFQNDDIEAIEHDILRESVNKNIIVKPVEDLKLLINGAMYYWEYNNMLFYLYVDKPHPNRVNFKFTNSENMINRTGVLQGKPATSIFSGAILAIKKYLDENEKVEFITLSADLDDKQRCRLYLRAAPYIEKITKYTYKDFIDDDELRVFIFRKESIK